MLTFLSMRTNPRSLEEMVAFLVVNYIILIIIVLIYLGIKKVWELTKKTI